MKYIKRIYIFALLWLASLTLNAQVTATITPVKATQKGSITLDIQGGAAPFSYEWYVNNTIKVFARTKDITDLDEGEYCVIVYDAKCCSAEKCFTIKKDLCGGTLLTTMTLPGTETTKESMLIKACTPTISASNCVMETHSSTKAMSC